MYKNILSSKRFWTGIISIITAASLVFTNEKSLSDTTFLGECFMLVMGFVQTVVSLRSTSEITVGGVSIAQK